MDSLCCLALSPSTPFDPTINCECWIGRLFYEVVRERCARSELYSYFQTRELFCCSNGLRSTNAGSYSFWSINTSSLLSIFSLVHYRQQINLQRSDRPKEKERDVDDLMINVQITYVKESCILFFRTLLVVCKVEVFCVPPSSAPIFAITFSSLPLLL